MPFIFLLLFALVCLQTQWPAIPDWLTPEGCAMLVGTMVLTSWLSAWLIACALAGQMLQHPDQRGPLLRRYGRWRRYHFIALLLVYLGTLYPLGWGQVFHDWWAEACVWVFGPEQENISPGIEVGLMIPFFAGLILSWERFYRVEKTAFELVHQPDHFLTKRSYLLLQFRHQMILIVPPVLLLLLQQLLFAFFPHWDEDSYLPAIIVTLMMATAFVVMPLLLRAFLGLKPLPPGPLRDRLEQTARRLHFGYSNVLVWNTRNLFANALVTGFIPWIRYVVLTDRLIDELTPDEIEAVFGHEVGHIKHHHLLFYLAFFLTSFIVLGQFWEIVKDWITEKDTMSALQGIPMIGEEIRDTLKTLSSFGKLGLLAVYTLLVFGFLSRRCERQADLFGARTVSTDAFISALEKVASINGIPRDRGGNWFLSWQHPTIAQRVDFLLQMRDNPALVPPFHRGIVFIQIAFFAVLGFMLWFYELPKVWLWIRAF